MGSGHGFLTELKARDKWFPLPCLLLSMWLFSNQLEWWQTVYYICLMEQEINTMEKYVLLPNFWEYFIFCLSTKRK